MVTRSRRIAGVAALYLVVLAIVIYATLEARCSALRVAAARDTQAQAEWTQWRQDVEEGRVSDDAVVARRTPKSTEPPWLVLMRDHFAVCLAAAIVFSSLLFWLMAFFFAAVRREAPRGATVAVRHG